MKRFNKLSCIFIALILASSCQKTMTIMNSIPVYSSVEEMIQVFNGRQDPIRFTQLPYSGEIATHQGRYKLDYFYDPLLLLSDPLRNSLDSNFVCDTSDHSNYNVYRLFFDTLQLIVPTNLHCYFQRVAGVHSCFFIGTTLYRVYSQGILSADIAHQDYLYIQADNFDDHAIANSGLTVVTDFYEAQASTVCTASGTRCGPRMFAIGSDMGSYFDISVLTLAINGEDYPMFMYKAYPLKKQWGAYCLASGDLTLSIGANIEIAYQDRSDCQTETVRFTLNEPNSWHLEGIQLFTKGRVSDIRIVESNSWLQCDSVLVGKIVI